MSFLSGIPGDILKKGVDAVKSVVRTTRVRIPAPIIEHVKPTVNKQPVVISGGGAGSTVEAPTADAVASGPLGISKRMWLVIGLAAVVGVVLATRRR